MKQINVAIFKAYSKFFHSGMEIIKNEILGNYEWNIDGTKYKFKTYYLGKWATIFFLKPDKFHVVIMPGANTYWALRKGSPIFSNRWKNAIRNFVKNGGGYIGICGGSTIACQGRKTSDSKASSIAEFLKISNNWANQIYYRQDQYDIRNPNTGGIPINVEIRKSGNPIFDPFYFQHSNKARSIRYWGGPAFIIADSKDDLLGHVNILATYAEEPMEKALLHWFASDLKVKTDMKGKGAIISTTYGKGRIVLFGCHPDAPTWYDGHIEENYVSYPRYEWIGKKTDRKYNWWMLRRAAAWAAKVPDEHLPEEFMD